MKALNKRSDWKGLLQVGGHLGLIVPTATTSWWVQEQLYLLLPKGLVAAWKEIIATLKKQKVDPEYQHIPQLPSRVAV